ncbi:hypothetical protein N9150_02895 [Akkermansiaceae bacterium]|nr:hypothetical protein [Akkermansiaceae bacterium]
MILSKKVAQDYLEYCNTYEGEIDDISEYTELGEGSAALLANLDESLYLKLRQLSEDDARVFLKHKKGLSLSGSLLRLSEDAAEILARYEGELNLSNVLVGERGKVALAGRDNVLKEEEWHSYVTVIDDEWVSSYDPETESGEQKYLASASTAKLLVARLGEEDADEIPLGSFNYYSVDALKEIAKHDDDLFFNWGEKYDLNGGQWTDEHFEALGAATGRLHLFCGGLGEDPGKAISANQLAALRKQHLNLEYVTVLNDDCYEAIKGREGETLWMESMDVITPRIAEALSTVKGVRVGEVTNLEALKNLCGPHSLVEDLVLKTKYIDEPIASILANFNGFLLLSDVMYITEDAAKILGNRAGSLFLEGESVLVEGVGLESLMKHHDSPDWPEGDLYDKDEEWVRAIPWGEMVNQVIEESDVKVNSEDDYSWVETPERPMITDAALKKMMSNKAGDLSSIRILQGGQAEIIASSKDDVALGVCHLTDEQVDILLKIRAGISLSNLRAASEASVKKLIRSQKVNELGGDLAIARQEYQNSGEDLDNDVDDEEENDVVGDIYFDYGRLKARLSSDTSSLGGPMDLLDNIEERIKGGGFPYRLAKIESLLGEFFIACVEDRDTSDIKGKIDDLFWNPEDE